MAVEHESALEAAQAQGAMLRAAYAAALPEVVRRPLVAPRELDCEVWTLSGEEHLPEQVASLRSLLAFAGVPAAIRVVSDGSHGARARELLRRVHPRVEILDVADVACDELPPAARRLARCGPMGAKLALELSLPVERPTVYVDADVLFFAGARELADLVTADDPRPRFLRDEEPYLDRRLLDPGEDAEPLNAGFLVLREPLAWAPALARLERLGDEQPVFHTEQTLVHLAVHASAGMPLDPERHVVANDDRHDLADRHAGPRLVLRHYTTPVRHKLWLVVAGTSATER